MFYVFLAMVWMSNGDYNAAAKAFPTMRECKDFGAAFSTQLEAHGKDDGVASARGNCVPMSNPATEKQP